METKNNITLINAKNKKIPNPEKEQHFLIDKKILEKEIKIANLTKQDRIIEIGAGEGILTKQLAEKGGEVLSFELDEDLKDKLAVLENKYTNLKIIYKNALKHSWQGYNKIVSNIPYSLSEPILQKAIKSKIKMMVLIISQGFKDKIQSKETKVRIFSDLFFKLTSICKVNKESFFPPPRVDSWLVKFIYKEKPKKIERILRNIVLSESKTKNAIMRALLKEGQTKNQARELIKQTGLDELAIEKSVKRITWRFFLRLKKVLEDYL